ncbi:MAG: hypothetical protein GX624_08225 [Actinobacteria bacterium]|nr:hypothetical protein [Actinomycetota bacterium]
MRDGPRRTPGPPKQRIQFLEDGMLLITAGSVTLMLTRPSSGLAEDGWYHESGCRCRYCRRLRS